MGSWSALSSVILCGMDAVTLLGWETPWWAKIRHAGEHIGRLQVVCDEYRALRPFSVEAEATETTHEVAYRLRHKIDLPKVIPLIVDDVLDNLRSALDNLIHGLVQA